MYRVLIVMLIAMLGVGMTSAVAEEEKESFAENAGEKLVEGLEQTVEGSVQIPAEMAEAAKEGNLAEAVTLAPIEGAKETALQTTEGAIRTATFLIPDSAKEDSTATSSE